jgi:glycosyltransferase involved in cell wall biosynthesis
MKFSIIIPSFNQDQFIERTFENLKELKERAATDNVIIELLLFDNCSNEKVQNIIKKYNPVFDFIEIKQDKGQYDAINKGIAMATGNYWSWLNTDDLIDIEGFLKLVAILRNDNMIDYIYGGVRYINENEDFVKDIKAYDISLNRLINISPGISQPGSFFKKEFTDKIGILGNYSCCFDYEFILRILKNNGKIKACNFIVSNFRYYKDSKTGSIIPVFVKEQLKISKNYGRNVFSQLTLIAYLRLVKYRYLKFN